jgi:glyoxylase I family protein
MNARLDNHIALRVRDVDRAVAFYCDALGGRRLTEPRASGNGIYEEVFATSGVQLKMSIVAFESGAVELWQFLEPAEEIPPNDQWKVGIMHFGVQVDDVSAALERVEAAGGRRRFPIKRYPLPEGDRHFVYCEDPDGHVFELIEFTMEDAAGAINARRQQRSPSASG